LTYLPSYQLAIITNHAASHSPYRNSCTLRIQRRECSSFSESLVAVSGFLRPNTIDTRTEDSTEPCASIYRPVGRGNMILRNNGLPSAVYKHCVKRDYVIASPGLVVTDET